MSAPADPVAAGHAAYAAAIARGATPGDAYRAQLVARETAYGHADADERAELLLAMLDDAHRRGRVLGAIEAGLGLRDRALGDGSVPTARLRELVGGAS